MSDDYIQDALFGGHRTPQKYLSPSRGAATTDAYRNHKIAMGVFLAVYFLFVFFNNPKPLKEILKENILLLMVILVAMTVHECAHAWINYKMGDPTAKEEGRVSLNPLVHIDWIGLLLFFLGGLGWAKAVPVDPTNFKEPDRGMVISAAMGPLSNFMLAILGGAFLKFQMVFLKGFYQANPVIGDWAFSFTLMFIAFNIGVGFFNFIPLPPLDGSHVLKHSLPADKREFVTAMEVYGSMILMLVVSSNIPRNLLGPLIKWSMDGIFMMFMIKG